VPGFDLAGLIMKQHNAASHDGRKCWNSARERERTKARFEIRKRVLEGGAISMQATNVKTSSDETMFLLLRYVREGNRSKFSTKFMDCNFAVFSSPHPIRHILGNPVTHQQTFQLMTKQNSKEEACLIQNHIQKLSLFTITEYAVWLQKYSIVSSMVHGGVNPTCRSSYFDFDDSLFHQKVEQQEQQIKLAKIGGKVLQRFFNTFPLRLSTYIVTRVVQMRMLYHADNDTLSKMNRNKESTTTSYYDEDTKFRCVNCRDVISVNFMLQCNTCEHILCEFCFWTNMLLDIDTPEKYRADDVISCIACGETRARTVINSQNKNKSGGYWVLKDFQDLRPKEKYELSLGRFLQLPMDQKALKESLSTKKKATEVDFISSNWQQAVHATLGLTQSVRMDKWWAHISNNSIPYVAGCLLAGVDVNQTNDYGQSAIYIAAWRGYNELVKVLLEHGADPFIPANGSNIFDVCLIDKNMEVIELIDQYYSSLSALNTGLTRNVIDDSIDMKCISLIPELSNHPGAGSCCIDEAISSSTVDILLQLFHSLPFNMNQKQKKNAALCSDRSYFCDAEGSTRKLLENAIERAFGMTSVESVFVSSKPMIKVFPHMRFLNYSVSGAVLPPHVDLCRVNPFCNPSEKQNQNNRSTHTFILYLTDCQTGGDTNLLERVSSDGSAEVLARISPQRGRLLLFPHMCPHEGAEVIDVPKILLRGEVQLI